MPVLYLTEQGSKLTKTSKRLIVEKDDQVLLELQEFKVDQVLIFGNVQVSTQALGFLLTNDIPLTFFTIHGQMKGRLVPVESKNVYLRLRQYERFQDEGFKVFLSHTIVCTKLKNMKAVLMRHQRNHPELDFQNSILHFDECLRQAGQKTQVAGLMGVEGAATARYFHEFPKLLRSGFAFEGRRRRPPRDPVNALLSFGYTLVMNEIIGALSACGLDPYVGFLHSIDYGRPSLALDILEEFRQLVVDLLTLSLLNLAVLKPEDFEEDEKRGVYLKEASRKTYFLHYDRKLNDSFQEQETGSATAYRKSIHEQARKMVAHIKGEQPYRGFTMP